MKVARHAMDDPVGFNRWTAFVFDHPVVTPEWYWEIDYDGSDAGAAVVIAYLTRLFEDAATLLHPYTDAQINQGLWFLVDNSCSNYMFSLLDTTIPLSDRQRCIRGIATLFRTCLAARCTPTPSHLDEAGASPLNEVCYMWWDVIPLMAEAQLRPDNPDAAEIDRSLLAVMTEILSIDSVACQESALHGLGHWQMYYPEIIAAVDEFLKTHSAISAALRDYALAARSGSVL